MLALRVVVGVMPWELVYRCKAAAGGLQTWPDGVQSDRVEFKLQSVDSGRCVCKLTLVHDGGCLDDAMELGVGRQEAQQMRGQAVGGGVQVVGSSICWWIVGMEVGGQARRQGGMGKGGIFELRAGVMQWESTCRMSAWT